MKPLILIPSLMVISAALSIPAAVVAQNGPPVATQNIAPAQKHVKVIGNGGISTTRGEAWVRTDYRRARAG